jgi:hypothetical protein
VVPYQNDAHNQQLQKTRHHKGEGKQGIMEKLTIKTPSDVLSFIGHTLGFWPKESLVCITLNEDSIGATLRIDLFRQPGLELAYARTVIHYLTSDTTATSVLFAVYTSEPAGPGQAKPHAGTIAALTGVLAEQCPTRPDSEFHEAILKSMYTTYHLVGTARMGDPAHELTVVDPELRVRG